MNLQHNSLHIYQCLRYIFLNANQLAVNIRCICAWYTGADNKEHPTCTYLSNTT